MATLRAKIEPDPHRPVHIHTVRDLGYRFEPGPPLVTPS
jgi:DNA-binding response OmpR family regulator